MWRRFKKGNVERDALAEKFKKIAANTDANFAQMRLEGIRSLESVIAFERHGEWKDVSDPETKTEILIQKTHSCIS
jgi:hypothetical protein